MNRKITASLACLGTYSIFGFSFLFSNYAVNHISVAAVSIFSNFCTVISVLAGIFIMHDSFSPIQIVGVIIIIISVFGISVPDKSRQKADEF